MCDDIEQLKVYVWYQSRFWSNFKENLFVLEYFIKVVK